MSLIQAIAVIGDIEKNKRRRDCPSYMIQLLDERFDVGF
jgi:hypothetical protein